MNKVLSILANKAWYNSGAVVVKSSAFEESFAFTKKPLFLTS